MASASKCDGGNEAARFECRRALLVEMKQQTAQSAERYLRIRNHAEYWLSYLMVGCMVCLKSAGRGCSETRTRESGARD